MIVKITYDNCKNKKTFEYKRYSTIAPHHKQWIDNPLFNNDCVAVSCTASCNKGLKCIPFTFSAFLTLPASIQAECNFWYIFFLFMFHSP